MKKLHVALVAFVLCVTQAQLIWAQLPTAAQGAFTSPFKTLTRPDGTTVNIVNAPDVSAPTRPLNAPTGVVSMPPALNFFVNYGALMKPIIGYDTARMTFYTDTNPGVAPTNFGTAFRVNCTTSHMGRFDPLVYPGRAEAGHLHTFFGNSDITGLLNAETLGDLAHFGRSSCKGGILNRSAYWIPTIVDIKTGVPMVPTANEAYYKSEGTYRDAHPNEVTAPPAGLRMIAGNPASSTDQPGITYWACVGGAGGGGGTQLGHIHTEADLAAAPTECGAGGDLMLIVKFPQCWDGKHLDSPNHQSHMAYQDFAAGVGCPSTHPVMLPVISFNIHWSIDKLGGKANFKNLRLSSDNYSLSIPGGNSAHGDWINGWDPATMNMIISRCLRTHTDCHDSVLDAYGTNPYRVMY